MSSAVQRVVTIDSTLTDDTLFMDRRGRLFFGKVDPDSDRPIQVSPHPTTVAKAFRWLAEAHARAEFTDGGPAFQRWHRLVAKTLETVTP